MIKYPLYEIFSIVMNEFHILPTFSHKFMISVLLDHDQKIKILYVRSYVHYAYIKLRSQFCRIYNILYSQFGTIQDISEGQKKYI